MANKKICLIGHMRHGKDTVAEMIKAQFGLTFESSSVAASRIFLFDALKEKYGYQTPEECFEDRVNHRQEWHDLICEYNITDKTRLAKEIMKQCDIYVGMRSNDEIMQCLHDGIFDLVIGVYDPRKPLEPTTSFNIDIWQAAHLIIPNGGTLDDLFWRVMKLESFIIGKEMTYAL